MVSLCQTGQAALRRSRLQRFGGHGVDVRLRHSRTTREVYWDRIGNSYVAVRYPGKGRWVVDGLRAEIVSINGAGEVRWVVDPQASDVRDKAAARHFDALPYDDSPYLED